MLSIIAQTDGTQGSPTLYIPVLIHTNTMAQFAPVFRIRISFHADPDPGSQKCPYGSGSKEVNTKEE